MITLVTAGGTVSASGTGVARDHASDRNSICRERQGLHRFLLCLSVPEFLNLSSLFFFLTLVIFIGGVNLPYYSFPMTAFVLTAAIAAGFLLEGLPGILRQQKGVDAAVPGEPEQTDPVPSRIVLAADNTGWAKQEGVFLTQRVPRAAAASASLLLGFFLVWTLSMNTSYRRVSQEDLWLYRFRDYIAASGIASPGILNMNCFDAGLYTVTDATPVCYYFQTQTLNMEEVLDVQKACMRGDAVDFILSRDIPAEGLQDRYALVLTGEIDLKDFCHTYYLYQKTE